MGAFKLEDNNLIKEEKKIDKKAIIKEYLLNFNDYKKSDKDTYDDYYQQLVETDSRAFSEKRLQEFYLAFIEK